MYKVGKENVTANLFDNLENVINKFNSLENEK